MKSTMTERDKKLLVGMLIGVIIVAIGYWGIIPQIKAYNKISSKIENEQKEKKVNELKVMNVGAIQVQANNYESQIAEKKDEFYQMLSSSEVDRMMTEMATNNNLEIYELNFNMPTSPSERLAYKNSELYNTQLVQIAEYDGGTEEEADENTLAGLDTNTSSKTKIKTEAEINEEIFGETEGGYRPNTDIYAVPVSMTVSGELSDLNNFIDDIINNDKRILMIGYAWGEYRSVINNSVAESEDTAEEAEGESSDEAGVSSEEIEEEKATITKKSLTIRLEIYMCDTSDVASTGDATQE